MLQRQIQQNRYRWSPLISSNDSFTLQVWTGSASNAQPALGKLSCMVEFPADVPTTFLPVWKFPAANHIRNSAIRAGTWAPCTFLATRSGERATGSSALRAGPRSFERWGLLRLNSAVRTSSLNSAVRTSSLINYSTTVQISKYRT